MNPRVIRRRLHSPFPNTQCAEAYIEDNDLLKSFDPKIVEAGGSYWLELVDGYLAEAVCLHHIMSVKWYVMGWKAHVAS